MRQFILDLVPCVSAGLLIASCILNIHYAASSKVLLFCKVWPLHWHFEQHHKRITYKTKEEIYTSVVTYTRVDIRNIKKHAQ